VTHLVSIAVGIKEIYILCSPERACFDSHIAGDWRSAAQYLRQEDSTGSSCKAILQREVSICGVESITKEFVVVEKSHFDDLELFHAPQLDATASSSANFLDHHAASPPSPLSPLKLQHTFQMASTLAIGAGIAVAAFLVRQVFSKLRGMTWRIRSPSSYFRHRMLHMLSVTGFLDTDIIFLQGRAGLVALRRSRGAGSTFGRAFYKGGFEPNMNRREAALILEVPCVTLLSSDIKGLKADQVKIGNEESPKKSSARSIDNLCCRIIRIEEEVHISQRK
jgi:hypothetical protein